MKTLVGSPEDGMLELTWRTTPVRYLDAFLDYCKRVRRALGFEVKLIHIFQDCYYPENFLFIFELSGEPGTRYHRLIDRENTIWFYTQKANHRLK